MAEENWENLRQQLIGFGDQSSRKSYYPELQKKLAELHDSEERFKALSEASFGGVIIHEQGLILDCNNGLSDITGFSQEEHIGMNGLNLIAPESLPTVLANIRSGYDKAYEVTGIRKDGSRYPLAIRGKNVPYKGREVRVIEFRDITERKQSEENLRQSLQRLQNMSDAAGAYLWEIDTDMVYTYVTGQSAKVKGLPPEALLGHTPMEFMPAEDIHPVGEIVSRAIAEKSNFRLQHRDITPAGEVWWEEVYGTVFCDESGTVIGLRGTGMSINDRKRADEERLTLERQLLHAQKLESLGVLAGGIAHDFNNILTAIIGNAELAMMRLNPESPALENLTRIEKAAARAADLARQMLAYSGKGKFVVEHIDLNRLVQEMGHMLEVSISKKVVLRYNLTKSLPTVNVDATQIRQIIMNLVINASEAIGDTSGVIAITTGFLECNEAYLQEFWLTDPIPEGLYVSLEIADTGCGMDKGTLAKIFDPFFTTKFTGRGLGMAAVLGIVRGHKGAIKVYSEPAKGSSFKVLLPAGEKPTALFNGETANDAWRGCGVALLVDDEETVRAIGGEMLRELGFEVITATDGRDAVAKYAARNDICLVILDLTMPHMDGEQCFRELRQMDPNVKVIMSSGFSEHEVIQKFAGKGLAGFVQKPYKLSALQEAIKKSGAS